MLTNVGLDKILHFAAGFFLFYPDFVQEISNFFHFAEV